MEELLRHYSNCAINDPLAVSTIVRSMKVIEESKNIRVHYDTYNNIKFIGYSVKNDIHDKTILYIIINDIVIYNYVYFIYNRNNDDMCECIHKFNHCQLILMPGKMRVREFNYYFTRTYTTNSLELSLVYNFGELL